MQDLDWEIIEALHETGSITKTASQFFMSQPSLSRHIQGIEAELGVNIILRNKNGSVFTEEGEIVYRKAVEMINTMKDLKRELEAFATKKEGTIKIINSSEKSEVIDLSYKLLKTN